MIRPSVVLAAWGVMLAILGLVLALFSPAQYVWALPAGAALALAPLGAIVLVPGGRTDEPRPLPDTSLPTVVVAAGVAVIALGLAVGPWLVVIGAEILALGTFGLIRELRAQRRARRS
jgi:Cytochrome c oxidase subunit IV